MFPKYCKIADIYNECTLNGVFIDGVDASIRKNLTGGGSNSHVDLTDMGLQAKSLLSIQKESVVNPSANPAKLYTCSP